MYIYVICMYVCIYMCIYTYIYICIYIYIYAIRMYRCYWWFVASTRVLFASVSLPLSSPRYRYRVYPRYRESGVDRYRRESARERKSERENERSLSFSLSSFFFRIPQRGIEMCVGFFSKKNSKRHRVVGKGSDKRNSQRKEHIKTLSSSESLKIEFWKAKLGPRKAVT